MRKRRKRKRLMKGKIKISDSMSDGYSGALLVIIINYSFIGF